MRTFAVESYPIFLGGLRYEVVPSDEVEVAVERISGGYLVNVALDAVVYGACFRCLREVAQEVQARQQEFVPSNPDKWGEEDVSPFIEDFVIDVEALMREAVILALPGKLLCSPDCRGICPSCGQDWNTSECRCEEEEVDPRWEKLRRLKIQEEEEAGGQERERRETG
ncbi:MAG: hypothetical protein Kow00129_01740 [Thermoleophilia bacterium]